MRVIAAILTLIVLAATPAWAQTLYKWVDAEGTTHFTREPPENREYEVISAAAGRLGKQDNTDRNQGSKSMDEEASSATSPPPRMRETEPEVDPDEQAARCEQARQNQFWMSERRNIRVEDPETGETRQLSEKDRQDRLRQAQRYLEENC